MWKDELGKENEIVLRKRMAKRKTIISQAQMSVSFVVSHSNSFMSHYSISGFRLQVPRENERREQ